MFIFVIEASSINACAEHDIVHSTCAADEFTAEAAAFAWLENNKNTDGYNYDIRQLPTNDKGWS